MRVLVSIVAILMAQMASAETLTREVVSGRVHGLLPLMGYVPSLCTVFAAQDVTITDPPAHGVAKILKHELALGEAAPLCKKKRSVVPWLAYQASAGFRGKDKVGVTYYVPNNTGEIVRRFIRVNFDITVK